MLRARGNNLALKLRDKLLPWLVLRVDSGDGTLPFHKWCDVGNDLWKHGRYEEEDREFLRKILTNFKCFLDVGANCGIYTLLAAKNMRNGVVVAFEPSSLEFSKLSKTIAWNQLRNVISVGAAIGANEGSVTFSESLDGLGVLNRIGAPARPNTRNRSIQVPLTSIDAWVNKSGLRPDFIKLDVERYELDALKGCKLTIEKYRPIFMIEMMWSADVDHGTPEDIWEFLTERGYSWFGLIDRSDNVVNIFSKALTVDDLARRREVVRKGRYPSRNMFAVPSELIGALLLQLN